MSQNPFKREQNQERHLINKLAARVRNLERRFIDAGALTVDRCAHYDTLTVTSGGLATVTWGPIGGSFFDFLHGDAIFDYSTATRPKVLNDGWYGAAVWVNLTPAQGSFAGEYAQLAVDFDTGSGGDDNDLVQSFPLQDDLFGTATVTVPPCFIAAGHGFDAAVQHQHAGSLNFQSFVFVQRLA